MGRTATLFLAKSGGYRGMRGCPDLRRCADHSGGTVADSHGLPRFSCLLIIERKCMLQRVRCQPERPMFPKNMRGGVSCARSIVPAGFFHPVDIVDPPAASQTDQRKSRAVIFVIGAVKINLERYTGAGL
jgi:hypothetical protein